MPTRRAVPGLGLAPLDPIRINLIDEIGKLLSSYRLGHTTVLRNRGLPMNGSYTVAALMQTLFLEDAPTVAQKTGFQKRASKLRPDQFALAVVLGWLANPDWSLDELAQTAAQVNAPVSAQAIDQRFTPRAVAFFKELLLCAVRSVVRADDPLTAALLNRFSQVCLQDSTIISLPPGV